MCFHGAMKHKNDASNTSGCFQVVKIYTFMKEMKLYICTLSIVFLFVKSENNFIKNYIMFFVLS